MLIKNNSPVPPLPPRPPRNWFYGHTQNWPTIARQWSGPRRNTALFFNGPGFAAFPKPPALRRMWLGWCASQWQFKTPAEQADFATVGASTAWDVFDGAPRTLSAFEMFMHFNLSLFFLQNVGKLQFGAPPFNAPGSLGGTAYLQGVPPAINSAVINSDGTYTINCTGPALSSGVHTLHVYYSNPYSKSQSIKQMLLVDEAVLVGSGPSNIFSNGFPPFLFSSVPAGKKIWVGVRSAIYHTVANPTDNTILGPMARVQITT